MGSINRVAAGQSGILDDAAGLLDILQVGKTRRIEGKGGNEANVIVHEGQRHTLPGPRNEKVVWKLRGAHLHEGCPVGASGRRQDSEGHSPRAQNIALLIVRASKVGNHTRDTVLHATRKGAIGTTRGERGVGGAFILADSDSGGVRGNELLVAQTFRHSGDDARRCCTGGSCREGNEKEEHDTKSRSVVVCSKTQMQERESTAVSAGGTAAESRTKKVKNTRDKLSFYVS